MRFFAALCAVLAFMLFSGAGEGAVTSKSHHSFLCDEPGKIDGLRLQRSMDYSLCKQRWGGKEYCHYCRCEWARYWESAQPCFTTDTDYEVRILADQYDWKRDYSIYCMGLKADELSETPLLVSLDEQSAYYCNHGVKRTISLLPILLPVMLWNTLL